MTYDHDETPVTNIPILAPNHRLGYDGSDLSERLEHIDEESRCVVSFTGIQSAVSWNLYVGTNRTDLDICKKIIILWSVLLMDCMDCS